MLIGIKTLMNISACNRGIARQNYINICKKNYAEWNQIQELIFHLKLKKGLSWRTMLDL